MHPLLVAGFSVLALATTSSAFRLGPGDVYEWSAWDRTGIQETPLRLTVLDSIPGSGGFVDSGVVWRLLLQRDSRLVDTLQLFQFQDGDLRWKHGSALFPLELQSPHSVGAWRRGGLTWGEYVCGDGVEITSILIIGDGAEVEAKDLVGDPKEGSDRTTLHRVHGLWTDSLGPLWFQAEGSGDYFLVSKNGRAPVWQNPRLDSMRRRADSMGVALQGRRTSIRYPRLGDRYQWRVIGVRDLFTSTSVVRFYETITSKTSATVFEAPEDSSGWVRRSLKVFENKTFYWDPNGEGVDSVGWKSDTTIVHQRWDSLGNVRYDVATLLSTSWTVKSQDKVAENGSFRRGETDSYLASGVLLSRATPSGKDTARACTECLGPWKYDVSLEFAPDFSILSIDKSRLKPILESRLAIRELIRDDPRATVQWTGLDGRQGTLTASEFARWQRRGVFHVRIRTSRGEILTGKFLEM